MMKYIILITVLLFHTTKTQKLKKVQNCVCHCPIEELCDNCGENETTQEKVAINPILLGKIKNGEIRHTFSSKNSTKSTSTSSRRKTKKKVVKKHFSKRQIAMIHRAGEKLIKKYQRQNRFGHRNMGKLKLNNVYYDYRVRKQKLYTLNFQAISSRL